MFADRDDCGPKVFAAWRQRVDRRLVDHFTNDETLVFQFVKTFNEKPIREPGNGATEVAESGGAVEQNSQDHTCPTAAEKFHDVLEKRTVTGGVRGVVVGCRWRRDRHMKFRVLAGKSKCRHWPES